MNVTEVDEVGVNGVDCEDKTVERSLSKNLNRATGYPTPKTRQAFTQLRQSFTKALILQHLDLECYIWIETDMSDNVICEILSQLILDNLGQWHLIAYYLQKMISVKTRYKTHNGKLLAIVEVFKIWRRYLEGCKYKVLMLTNYNNFCHFMDTKRLSFCQICSAQKLFCYHFLIDYYQGKANRAPDALF